MVLLAHPFLTKTVFKLALSLASSSTKNNSPIYYRSKEGPNLPFHQGQQSQNVVPYHQYRFHRLAHRLAKIQAALGWGEDLLLSVQAPISTTTSQLDLAPHTDVPSPGKRNVGWLSTLPGSFNYVFSNMVPTFS